MLCLKPSPQQRRQNYSILKPHAALSIDIGVKIESRSAAWNGLKCETDSSKLYLDKTQSEKSAMWYFSYLIVSIKAENAIPLSLCSCSIYEPWRVLLLSVENSDFKVLLYCWSLQANGLWHKMLVGKSLLFESNLSISLSLVTVVSTERLKPLICYWEKNCGW